MRRSNEPHPTQGTEAALVFLLAVAAGLLNWWFLRDNPFLAHPIIDAAEYIADARAIVAGIPYWERAPIHGPLYPVFLSPFVGTVHSPLPALYFVQILLLGASAVLVRQVGVRLGGRLFGNIAGALLAVAPPMLYFEVQAVPVILQVFLHALLLFLLVRDSSGGGRSDLLAGVFGGLSYLAHPGSFFFLFLLAVFLSARASRRRRGLLFTAGALLPLLIVGALSARGGGEPLPVARNAGLNFYVGNGAGSDGTAHVRPGYEWERLIALPLREGIDGSGSMNRFFVERTLADWRADPGGALRRLAGKALLFGTGLPIDASQDFGFFRDRSPLLRAFVLDAGVLVPLALGFLFAPAGWIGAWVPVALGIAGYWIGTTLTVFAIRYRAPVWPFLVLLAPAFGAVWGRLTRSEAVRGAFAAIALLLVGAADPLGYREKNPVRTEYNLARLAYEQGDLAEARRLFESMWRREEDVDAANGLAVVEMSGAGGVERSTLLFQEALRIGPDYADAHFNLALALVRLGRDAEAAEHLSRAIDLHPAHAPALYLQGILLEQSGHPEGAEPLYREALSRDPTRDDAWTALGVLLARRGETAGAVTCFKRALRLNPASTAARENMARALARRPGGQ